MTRQEANNKILNTLKMYLDKYPNIRFIQALWNLRLIDRDDSTYIVDRYFEEPEITLKRCCLK